MNTHHDPDWLDARVVFRVYAWATGGLGAFLVGWGPMLLPGYPDAGWYARAPLVRTVGTLLVMLACVVAPLRHLEDSWLRRRILGWLMAAHALLAAILIVQYLAVWANVWGGAIAGLGVAVTMVLWYLWGWAEGHHPGESQFATTLFASRSATTLDRLRSRYEQQIREAAGQEERHRLARDLHDSVKQQIFVIQTAAATAQARFDGDQAGSRNALDQVRAAAREAMSEMEAMLDQLRDELTARERDVLRQVSLGRSNKEIAASLVVSEETVKTHVAHLFAKLQVENRAQAVVQALRRGVVTLEEL